MTGYRCRELTANDLLWTHLECLNAAIVVCNLCAKHHSTTRRFFLAPWTSRLIRKSMFDINVSFLENADTIARGTHVSIWLQIDFNDDRAFNFLLWAWRRIFAGNFACLIEHMWCHSTDVRSDENLQRCWFVVANKFHHRKTISASIFDGTSAAFSLIPRAMLLLWLGQNLQLWATIDGHRTDLWAQCCRSHDTQILTRCAAHRRTDCRATNICSSHGSGNWCHSVMSDENNWN